MSQELQKVEGRSGLRALVPTRRDQWVVLGLVVTTACALIWWSLPSWKLAVQHWKVTLTLGFLASVWMFRRHTSSRLVVSRIVSALEDAPAGLTGDELAGLLKASFPPELVHEGLRELSRRDAVKARGVGGRGVVRYQLKEPGK